MSGELAVGGPGSVRSASAPMVTGPSKMACAERWSVAGTSLLRRAVSSVSRTLYARASAGFMASHSPRAGTASWASISKDLSSGATSLSWTPAASRIVQPRL
jgi:hypothetical protein